MLVKTLVYGGEVRLVLIVEVAWEDGRRGVFIHDVAPEARVLDAVGEPDVLPDVGQLARPHLALLKGAFQPDNIPVLGHHVSVK